MAETQTYQNHVRWYPLAHFVLSPIFLLNIIWQLVRLIQDFNIDRVGNLVLAVAFFLLLIAARNQALAAQNRIIRLEEALRYQRVLSPDLAFQAEQLPTSSKIALRFAPDEELSELVQKAINGEFAGPKEIKLAIKNWRGDYLRV